MGDTVREFIPVATVPVLALSGDVDMPPGVDTSFFRKAAQAIANMVPHGISQLLPGQTTTWMQRSLLLF